jgi:hypothetical protein
LGTLKRYSAVDVEEDWDIGIENASRSTSHWEQPEQRKQKSKLDPDLYRRLKISRT